LLYEADSPAVFANEGMTEAAASIARDITAKDAEVRGLIDTTELARIISEQKAARKNKQTYISKTKAEDLVEQIRDNFENLRLIERNRKTGWHEGNGHMVTWAIGHLVGLAEPEAYGFVPRKNMYSDSESREKALAELPLFDYTGRLKPRQLIVLFVKRFIVHLNKSR
jgi:hypothetical protein